MSFVFCFTLLVFEQKYHEGQCFSPHTGVINCTPHYQAQENPLKLMEDPSLDTENIVRHWKGSWLTRKKSTVWPYY